MLGCWSQTLSELSEPLKSWKLGWMSLWEQPHLGYLGMFDSSWNPKLQREAKMKNNWGETLNFLKPQKEALVKFVAKVRDYKQLFFMWLHSFSLKKSYFNLPNERSLIFLCFCLGNIMKHLLKSETLLVLHDTGKNLTAYDCFKW